MGSQTGLTDELKPVLTTHRAQGRLWATPEVRVLSAEPRPLAQLRILAKTSARRRQKVTTAESSTSICEATHVGAVMHTCPAIPAPLPACGGPALS